MLQTTLQRLTNQRGAIPISLLNSHFHSSIGTSHSKTCIALSPLPGAAQSDNQVNTFSPHFPHTHTHTLNHRTNHTQPNTLIDEPEQRRWSFVNVAPGKRNCKGSLHTSHFTRDAFKLKHTQGCTHAHILSVRSPSTPLPRDLC